MPTFLFIDTETTGLPRRLAKGLTEQPRIVSIAWALWDSRILEFEDEYFVVKPDGLSKQRRFTESRISRHVRMAKRWKRC